MNTPVGRILTPEEVFARLPQQEPFRFLDEIVHVDGDSIVARYRWREDADFYRGHFPGNPITPGVLLVESMAQAVVVSLGVYLFNRDETPEIVEKLTSVFTDANVDFTGVVRPGDWVTITGKLVFFRRRKVRAEAEMTLDDGTVVCHGVLSGMGVMQ